jgi:hypothetical protein
MKLQCYTPVINSVEIMQCDAVEMGPDMMLVSSVRCKRTCGQFLCAIEFCGGVSAVWSADVQQ